MLFIMDEEIVRANPKSPVLNLGEPIHFAAMVRDEDASDEIDEDDGEGETDGFAENNFDAEVCVLADEDEAEVMFTKLCDELHHLEGELLEAGNEGFIAVYRVKDHFVMVAADNGGSEQVADLLYRVAEDADIDHHTITRCTADKVQSAIA